MKIGIIVGSLRKDSFNKKIAEVIAGLLPEGYEAEFLNIANLPLYNEDIDGDNPPQEYIDYREKLSQCDAFLLATPEYNRSYSAAIKNAIDVGSRPYTSNQWSGKPSAIVSASMGGFGGMAANNHLRQVLMLVNSPTLAQPEVYIPSVYNCFTEEGVNPDTKELLQKFVDAFVKHIERY